MIRETRSCGFPMRRIIRRRWQRSAWRHECGHAVQHAVGYAAVKDSGALVPVANFGSTLALPLILIGLLIRSGGSPLINLGILLFPRRYCSEIDIAGGIQCIKRAVQALEKADALRRRDRRNESGASGGGADLLASAASMILQLLRHYNRRKKTG